MNREIKFRGKCFDTKEWIYGHLIEDVIVKEIEDIDEDYLGIGEWCSVLAETLGQHTGLKDKNGIEIYEGDIIACGDSNVPTQILWVDEYGGWGAKNLKRNEIHALDKYFIRFIGEVIGNIYENPELLAEVTNDN